MSPQDPGTMRHGVHGLVSIELIGASEAQQRALVRQLGPSRATPDGPADIVVRFTDRFPRAASLTYLGAREAAYDEHAFYLLDRQRGDDPHRPRARRRGARDRV